jgi:hypothetical protein
VCFPRPCPFVTPFELSFRRGTTGSFGVPAALESDKDRDKEKHKDRPPLTVEMLDGYALERWEVRNTFLLGKPMMTVIMEDHLALHGILFSSQQAFSGRVVLAAEEWVDGWQVGIIFYMLRSTSKCWPLNIGWVVDQEARCRSLQLDSNSSFTRLERNCGSCWRCIWEWHR